MPVAPLTLLYAQSQYPRDRTVARAEVRQLSHYLSKRTALYIVAAVSRNSRTATLAISEEGTVLPGDDLEVWPLELRTGSRPCVKKSAYCTTMQRDALVVLRPGLNCAPAGRAHQSALFTKRDRAADMRKRHLRGMKAAADRCKPAIGQQGESAVAGAVRHLIAAETSRSWRLDDWSALTNRSCMYSGPTRLLKVNGGFRKQLSLSSESSKSAASLKRSADAGRIAAVVTLVT